MFPSSPIHPCTGAMVGSGGPMRKTGLGQVETKFQSCDSHVSSGVGVKDVLCSSTCSTYTVHMRKRRFRHGGGEAKSMHSRRLGVREGAADVVKRDRYRDFALAPLADATVQADRSGSGIVSFLLTSETLIRHPDPTPLSSSSTVRPVISFMAYAHLCLHVPRSPHQNRDQFHLESNRFDANVPGLHYDPIPFIPFIHVRFLVSLQTSVPTYIRHVASGFNPTRRHLQSGVTPAAIYMNVLYMDM
jgi:hypothetical protein